MKNPYRKKFTINKSISIHIYILILNLQSIPNRSIKDINKQTVTGILQEQVTEYVDIIHNNSRNKKICVIIANLHFEITVHVL